MNYLRCSAKNFLLYGNGNLDLEKTLEFSVNEAEKGHHSLILTCNSKLFITFNQLYDKSYLNRIIIMYFENIDKMITKILNLHDWTIHPNIVIVDLSSIFDETRENFDAEMLIPTKRTVCLLTSSILNYVQLLSIKESFTIYSITICDKNKLPKPYSQILLDLYFYNSKFYDFLSLKNSLPII